MRVVVTDTAWADMLEIGKAIREHNPRRAKTFVGELYDRCRELGSLHHAFSLVPRLEWTGVGRRP